MKKKKEIKHKMVIEKVGGGGLPYKYIAGYFCQGPESLPYDGLTCYIDVDSYSEKIRERYLSPVCKTKTEAIKQFRKLRKSYCEKEKRNIKRSAK